MTIILTIAATLLAVMLWQNLVPRRPEHPYALSPEHGVDSPQFAREMGQLLGPPLVGGTRVTSLVNGDQIFPAMLAAIAGAQHSITFETFIYWSGSIGARFVEALAERARAGVRIHIVVDWVGASRMEPAYLETLEDAGAEVVRYHPVKWYTLGRLNNRTHRKLLVVDGRIGFTGGVGIADLWLGNAEGPENWRDTHFQVEGPVVSQLQAAFMDNWLQTRGTVLQGEAYFPKLEPAGEDCAQVFRSSSREGSSSVQLMYLMAITAAQREILIANAYFVPDDQTVEALVAARRRGVTVEVIVPGKEIDARVVRAASRTRWEPLLEAGVRIWEYQPSMYHCKVLVVDGCWSSVGSTNLDNRSFRLNDEANLNVLSVPFAAEQAAQFAADKVRSREVKEADLKRRPLPGRVLDAVAGFFRSQL